MASCTATATTSCIVAGLPSLRCSSSSSSKPASQVGFCGFRAMNKLDGLSINSSSFESKTRLAKCAARTTCLQTSLIISLCTAASLSVGRFVFLPFQREQVAKAGLPLQNGVTHYEAGDSRAKEVVTVLKTNDPAGFTLVDVLAWGSIGHIIAYWILATSSNGYSPQF